MRTKLILGTLLMLAVGIGGGFAVVLKAQEGQPPPAPTPPEGVPQYTALHYARMDAAWAFGKAGIETCRQYVDLLARHAARRGINGGLLASIAVKESRCDALAVSPKRAAGLLQVHLPFWQCRPGQVTKCWDFTLPENNPFNADRNAAIATEILAELLARNDVHTALRKYNGNEGKGEETRRYADAVLGGAQ
jgi:soluble lytic murein transglycosylase-like protein